MKYAIISDIHGNLEALNAVLQSAEDAGCEKYVCVGDIVGYGANPIECVQLVKEKVAFSVMGNHDSAVIGKTATTYFNTAARMAVEWTRKALDDESKRYFESLPYVARPAAFTVVHSTIKDPEEWNYIFTSDSAEQYFPYQTDSICFISHTHVSAVFLSDGMVLPPQGRLSVGSSSKYMINCGSVGQPRDGDPRACYVTYDDYENAVTFQRVQYDIKTAQEKIRGASLPEVLAARLEYGK